MESRPSTGSQTLAGERLPEDPTLRSQDQSESQAEMESKVLWIDWDGPGDPQNPKKYVVAHENPSVSFNPPLAGLTGKNGRRQSLCHYSPSYLLSRHQ